LRPYSTCHRSLSSSPSSFSLFSFFSLSLSPLPSFLFFFNDTATTEIYTLSLHDALPILWGAPELDEALIKFRRHRSSRGNLMSRSEEHTSELQSLTNLVCRLLLEKKKKIRTKQTQW